MNIDYEEGDIFPGDMKPVHIGVYRRHYPSGPWFCWWDGKQWGVAATVPWRARANSAIISCGQHYAWNGLLADMGDGADQYER